MSRQESRAGGVDAARAKGRSQVLAEQVYDTLRREILTFELPPRRRLDEAMLVARFEISRTPVREALRRLSQEGLVELRPHQGASVAGLDLADAVEYFEVIQIVQKAVLVLAALRRTDADLAEVEAEQEALERASRQRDIARVPLLNRAFHLRMAAGSQNERLTGYYSRLLDDGMRMAHLPLKNYVARDWEHEMGNLIADHRALLAAFRARDADEMARVSDRHVALFRKQVFFALAARETDVEKAAVLSSAHLMKKEEPDG